MRGKRRRRIAMIVVAGSVGLPALLATGHAAAGVRLPDVRLGAYNRVPACVTPARLMAFLRTRNRQLDPRYRKVAAFYAKFGTRLGVRWDIGFLQMLVETANLTFRRPDGTPGDVAPQHNNFAGIGAIGDGRPGEIFPSIAHGVRAHLEHVLHYAGVAVVTPVAERTRKVQAWRVLADWHNGFDRPITYTDLALRWAPHTDAYLASIELLAQRFQDRYCNGQAVLRVPDRSQTSIAKTAWRFEKTAGRPGTAGTTPPTGKPNLSAGRGSLGAPVPRVLNRPAAAPTPAKRVAAVPKARPRRTVAAAGRGGAARTVKSAKPAPGRPRISRDDRIRQMISDRKILLRTHVGAVIPIEYDADGRMRGEAGALAFFLGSSRDKGRWWVEKGKLCQKWRIWLDRDVYCMRLKERRGTIWWHADDGKRGTARIVSK